MTVEQVRDTYDQLADLQKPAEEDPQSPISCINKLIAELEGFQQLEFYDPVELTRVCLDKYKQAAVASQKQIAYPKINAVFRLNLLNRLGVPPFKQIEEIGNRIMKVNFPGGLKKLATVQAWYVGARQTNALIQVLLGAAAYTVTYFSERAMPESESLVLNYMLAILSFVAVFYVLDRATENIKRRINWKMFHRTRTRALQNLRELKEGCGKYAEEIDALVPRPINPAEFLPGP